MSDDITAGLDDLDARLTAAAKIASGVGDSDLDDSDVALDARLAASRTRARSALGDRVDLDARLRRITGTSVQGAVAERTRRRWWQRLGRGTTTPAPDTAPKDPPRGTESDQRRRQPLPAAVAVQIDSGASQPPPGAAAHSSGDHSVVKPITLLRIATCLERLELRYLTDGDGSLLALWERHAVLFALEGASDEILVIRARPHATVPPAWAERSYRVVNEWNHTRRFYKAYVGDPTDRGQLPLYAEMQVPLQAGVHDELLLELIDCAAAVATGFVDWLHDEGALL